MALLEVARFHVYDVEVHAVFVDGSFDALTPEERREVYSAAHRDCGMNTVLIWQNSDGVMRFIAPPQQHPFFEALSFDQLHAQVNGTIQIPLPGTV